MNIDKLIKIRDKAKVDDLELYINSGDSVSFEIKDGKLDKDNRGKSLGIGIRIIKDHRESLVFTSDIRFENIFDKVLEGKELLSLFKAKEGIKLVEKEEDSEYISKDNALKMESITHSEKVELGREIEEDSKKSEKKVIIESVGMDESYYETRIFNTRGLDKIEKGRYCGAYSSLAVEENGKSETGVHYLYSRSFEDIKNEKIGAKALDNALSMLGAKIIKSGKYSAILSRESAVQFLSILKSSFNGNNIYKGKSILIDRLGDKIISDKITIIDDGTMSDVIGSSLFDGDGNAMSKTTVFDKGVFKGGLYNIEIGILANKKSTSNGSRNFTSLSGISTTNLYIESGFEPYDKLVTIMNNGLIIKDLMGLHLANPITGEFSLGASGFIVKNGKINGSFRGVTISGKVQDLFSEVEALGSDFKMFNSMGSPSILLNSINISGE